MYGMLHYTTTIITIIPFSKRSRNQSKCRWEKTSKANGSYAFGREMILSGDAFGPLTALEIE